MTGRQEPGPVLRLHDVAKSYHRAGVTVAAVAGVSLEVGRGETVGLVGESGSGKSTLGRLALMLIRPDRGEVVLEGQDLAALKESQVRPLRRRMQIVFQEPFECLDPQLSVLQSISEPLRVLRPRIGSGEVRTRALEALERVGLSADKAERYPRQLSGGEQQRVGIARSVATRPALLVLDEPTSSLDLTVRAGIVDLLRELQAELEMSYLFISHDLDTVESIADRVYVMRRGRIVESGTSDEVLCRPRHPYTRLLQAARLSTDPDELPVPLAPLLAEVAELDRRSSAR